MTQPEYLIKVPTISFSDLKSGSDAALETVRNAFGHSDSLGLVLISDIPHYMEYRRTLLKLASKLANLDQSELEKLADPYSKYMFGWSFGKEIVNGKLDFSKGSFYANPQYDTPTVDKKLMDEYPEYCHCNKWPESLPELRDAFRNLGQLMVDVGLHLARCCDTFMKLHSDDSEVNLEGLISQSKSNKGRLLHYYPREDASPDEQDSWCGLHLDHSLLTTLTAPMYAMPNEPFDEVVPDNTAGLYIKIKNKDGVSKLMKADIPENCLAIQTGEALQVMSGGILHATPHCVKASKLPIARNTLAVFLQPDWNREIRRGLFFGDFTKTVLSEHY
jgi:isopenicillin N synthase-like dioxygenase